MTLLVLVACRSLADEEYQSVSLVVTKGIVVDGAGDDPVPDGLVAIQGKRIVFGRQYFFSVCVGRYWGRVGGIHPG